MSASRRGWSVGGSVVLVVMTGCSAGSVPEATTPTTTIPEPGVQVSPSEAGTTPAGAGACPARGDSPGAAGIGDPLLPLIGNGGYDVSHYDLDLFIDPGRNLLEGAMSIDARATHRLTSFNLDFSGPAISEVRVNDRPAAHCREGGELVVVPDSPIEDGAEFGVEVAYGGTPTGLMRPGAPTREGWNPLSDDELTAGGLWGAEAAHMPVNATNQDKATFRMAITVPAPLAVAATGSLVEITESDDSSTYVWISDVPTPPSRVFLATGRFEVEREEGPAGIQYEYVMPPDTSPDLRADLARATPIIETLTDTLGPPPFDTLGFTQVEDTLSSFAISAQMRIFVMGQPGIGDAVLAHELGHQWFGNSVTPATTQDDWLSEGFATYTETVWVEANLGPDRRDDLPRTWLSRIGDSTRRLAVVDEPEQLGDSAAYFRGAATLHALRVEVGDEPFARTLGRYALEFRHSVATTEDFMAVAEAESSRDLSDFFEAWLYQEAVPVVPAGEP